MVQAVRCRMWSLQAGAKQESFFPVKPIVFDMVLKLEVTGRSEIRIIISHSNPMRLFRGQVPLKHLPNAPVSLYPPLAVTLPFLILPGMKHGPGARLPPDRLDCDALLEHPRHRGMMHAAPPRPSRLQIPRLHLPSTHLRQPLQLRRHHPTRVPGLAARIEERLHIRRGDI